MSNVGRMATITPEAGVHSQSVDYVAQTPAAMHHLEDGHNCAQK